MPVPERGKEPSFLSHRTVFTCKRESFRPASVQYQDIVGTCVKVRSRGSAEAQSALFMLDLVHLGIDLINSEAVH